GQRMMIVSNWPGIGWTSNAYQDNTQITTIYGANHPTYPMNVESSRGGQVQRKVWPLLNTPTNLSKTSYDTPSIELNWTNNAADYTGFTIRRSTNGSNYSDYADTTLTHYLDTAVINGTHYWYCVSAYNEVVDNSIGPPVRTVGPCSSSVDAIARQY